MSTAPTHPAVEAKTRTAEAILGRALQPGDLERMTLSMDGTRVVEYDRPTSDPDRRRVAVHRRDQQPDGEAAERWNRRVHEPARFAAELDTADAAVGRAPQPQARARSSHSTRPGHRRTRSTRAGPGSDDDPPSEHLCHVSIPLADELSRIADRLRARGGIG